MKRNVCRSWLSNNTNTMCRWWCCTLLYAAKYWKCHTHTLDVTEWSALALTHSSRLLSKRLHDIYIHRRLCAHNKTRHCEAIEVSKITQTFEGRPITTSTQQLNAEASLICFCFILFDALDARDVPFYESQIKSGQKICSQIFLSFSFLPKKKNYKKQTIRESVSTVVCVVRRRAASIFSLFNN